MNVQPAATRTEGVRSRASRAHDTGRWRQVVDVAARTVAAIAGGYAVTAMATALLAYLLPWTKIEATVGAGTFSFVIYVTIACWAFAARKAWQVWAVLSGLSVLLIAALYQLLGGMPGL